MVYFYCDGQSCMSLASMARLSNEDEIDDFSLTDVNESPSEATSRNVLKSTSQISGSVHTLSH